MPESFDTVFFFVCFVYVLVWFGLNAFILIADNVPDSSIMLLNVAQATNVSSVWEYI